MSIPHQPGPTRSRGSRATRRLDATDVPVLYHPTARGGAVMHGNLSLIAGTSRSIILYLVLLAGAGIDVATFYQVLAKVLPQATIEVIWVGVVGTTVTSLTLAHMLGSQLREHVARHRPARSSPASWLCLTVWLLIGAVAFVIRLLANDVGQSEYTVDGVSVVLEGTDGSVRTALLPALLFLALYFGTGTVAALAGYTRHHPHARQYGKAVKARTRRARRRADSAANRSQAEQTWAALREHRRRLEDAVRLAEDECVADASRLKQHIRIVLAGRTDPGANGPWDAGHGPQPPAGGRLRTIPPNEE